MLSLKKSLTFVSITGLLLSLCLLFGCNRKHNKVTRAFYFWRSAYQLNAAEKQIPSSLHIQKLYLKYFEVVWKSNTSQALPEAVIRFSSAVAENTELVPVVFIVNDVLKKSNPEQLTALAQNVSSLLKKINLVNKIRVKEIQFDCDWSDATKEKYFSFLKTIKTQFGKEKITFSATIRLHQIKYYKRTGIPPVEKGMLMFYNMGKLKNPLTVNSIFDASLAEKYIDYIKSYPLKLDYALPVFSWGVHLRNNKVIGLENNIASADLDTLHQLNLIKPTIFYVQQGFFFRGTYFQEGDRIRVEEISPELALKAAKILSDETNSSDFTVSLFHLDSSNIKRYEIKNFEAIYNSFN